MTQKKWSPLRGRQTQVCLYVWYHRMYHNVREALIAHRVCKWTLHSAQPWFAYEYNMGIMCSCCFLVFLSLLAFAVTVPCGSPRSFYEVGVGFTRGWRLPLLYVHGGHADLPVGCVEFQRPALRPKTDDVLFVVSWFCIVFVACCWWCACIGALGLCIDVPGRVLLWKI